MPGTVQGKNWCFTLNNYTQEEYTTFLSTDSTYVVVGKEVGAEGTPHLQGYICFRTNKRLTAVKAINGRAHWELARGDSMANFTYCSKDGDFVEQGTRPMTRSEQRRSQQEHYADVIRAARAGTVEVEYPREFVQYNSTLLRLYSPVIADLDSYCGIWCMGNPGAGKSRWARHNFPGFYDKLINKWYVFLSFYLFLGGTVTSMRRALLLMILEQTISSWDPSLSGGVITIHSVQSIREEARLFVRRILSLHRTIQ